MIKYPLFGKDSIPHKTSFFLGLIITASLTLIFFILSLVIKFPEKEKFSVVRINLESTPLVKNAEVNSLPAVVEEKPLPPQEVEQKEDVLPKETSNPVKKENLAPPKSQIEKTNELSSKKEKALPAKKIENTKSTVTKEYAKLPEYELVKSVDQMIEEQIDNQKASIEDFNWDIFETGDSSTFEEKETLVSSKSVMEGAAAEVNKESESSMTSKVSSQKSTRENSASSATKSALQEIKSVTKLNDGSKTDLSFVKVNSDDSKSVKIAMEDGSIRALLSPSSPSIIISEEAAKLIEGNRTVQIKFRVIESGNVPFSEISITPLSVLPQAVRREIESQLSNWIFEPASYDSTAVFDFSIVKK